MILREFLKRIHNRRTQNFTRELIEADEFPGLLHKCPQCGGTFHFHLTILNPKQKLADVLVWCDDCQAAMSLHGICPFPDWAYEADQKKQFDQQDVNFGA